MAESGNVFAGAYSGTSTVDGKDNTFVGYSSGHHHVSGSRNLFIGSQSGYNNTSGSGNTFIGWESGYENTDGRLNTMLGFQAGRQNTSGEHNIFIGGGAANLPQYTAASNKFVVGVENHPQWLTGDITSIGNLYVNGQQVALTSSRSLKKNIQPVENVQEYLEDILRTPLFTYYYKNESDLPEKQRMGIISEELPDRLQIKKEGKLSHPDWPSIYGSLWAGIKALYELWEDFKFIVYSQIHSLTNQFDELSGNQRQLIGSITQLQNDMQEAQKEVSDIQEGVKQAQRELLEMKRDMQRKRKELALFDKTSKER